MMLPETTGKSGQHTVQDRARKVAVCYLLRHGNPDRLFAAFLESLRRYPGGMPYRPVLIQKGFAPGFVHPLARTWPTPDGRAPEIVAVTDEGFDLTAYRKAAQAIDVPMLLFFNSYSRVLAAGWLSKLYDAAKSLGPGAVVGATGSWEALGGHTTFPNVAIRSNAFLIERDRFLAFAHPLDSKRDCNLFEAGPDSMTRNIVAAGGRIAIVDRDGRVIEPEDWPEAGVFRSGNQEKLLVADNRTMDYQCVSLRRRTRRARLAFGDRAVIRSQNFISRWWLAIAWRLGRSNTVGYHSLLPRSSELTNMVPEASHRSDQGTGQECARDVAVFFLLYPLRSGNMDRLYAAFLESLRRYPAGMPYRPVLIQKGYAPGFVHPLTRTWPTPDGCAPEVVEVPYKGFDLDAYRKAAQAIDAPMLLFFNSYSRVLAADWLSKLYDAAKSLGPGAVVGATGSWEALGEHTAFPNVAIRTNAFMIERDRFLSFTHPLDTKRDTNLFEAGPDNMTKNIRAAGGRVAIVDRDGRVIGPEDWPEAGVFRSGNQERLLVADNRTMDYQCVSLRRRTRRARLAFGDRAVIRSQNFISRWWLAIAWRRGWL